MGERLNDFIAALRTELSEEQKIAALKGAAFFLLISAPRKSSHSLAGGEVNSGLFLALLGGVDVPAELWRGKGWYRADRAQAWAEKNLLPRLEGLGGYPQTKSAMEDLLYYYCLEGYLVEFTKWLYHNADA